MNALGSEYRQLGLPSGEHLTLPEFATDKKELAKAKKMIKVAIRKQFMKGAAGKKGRVIIRPCCSPGVIQGYSLSKRRSTVLYSGAAMQLKAEGLISEIRWTYRKGKRVIDSIVAISPGADKKQGFTESVKKKKAKSSKPKKKPSTAFDLLLKNRDLPPWVHRWAKKSSASLPENIALLLDAYFELLAQESVIPERTLACYALSDSKSGGNVGRRLADVFQRNCPCLKEALESCSDVWERLDLLGIERISGSVMISGPIVIHGHNGEVFDASLAGSYGLGVADSLVAAAAGLDVSKAQGCLFVENEACYQYASRLLHDRVVTVYCFGQPSSELVGFARNLDSLLKTGAPRYIWLDIDTASMYSANKFIKSVPSFRTLMMGDTDFAWLQENRLLRKPQKKKLSAHDHQVLNSLEQTKLAPGIDKSLIEKLHANASAEQEAFIGDYALNVLMGAFPESKCSKHKVVKHFNLISCMKELAGSRISNFVGNRRASLERKKYGSAYEQDVQRQALEVGRQQS